MATDKKEKNTARVGGFYTGDSPAFHRGVLWGLSRGLKSAQNDAAVFCEYE